MSKAKSLPALIPAVAYVRKSTKGQRAGREKQEKSIEQQRAEIIKLAAAKGYVIEPGNWFEDDGVSGWKREAKRPHFQKMLDQVKELGAQAILCDHLDRFSRATYDDVQEDTGALRKAGVRKIVTVSHGDYDLQAGQRNDIGGIITFAAAVWGAHEYSRNLSRRISLARRNAALEGKRTGGKAPYGMANDGKGGLVWGDPKEIKVLRWLFDQSYNQNRSMNDLADDLFNKQKIRGPVGKWTVKTIKLLLTNPAYRGDSSYGNNPQGQFTRLNDKHEVVDRAELNGAVPKPIERKGVYKPIIDPVLFDKVQARLKERSKDRGLRKRLYVFSGLLYCGHCNARLQGARQVRWKGASKEKREYSPTVYRCSASEKGRSSCPLGGKQQVREDRLMMFLRPLFAEEIKTIADAGWKQAGARLKDQRADRREENKQEREKLAAEIELAEYNMDRIPKHDEEGFKRAHDRLVAKRSKLAELDARIGMEEPPATKQTPAEAARLSAFYEDLWTKVELLPRKPDPNKPDKLLNLQMVSRRTLNEELRKLGMKVEIWWTTVTETTKQGTERPRHLCTRGRFRLGQRTGKIPGYVLEPSAGPTSFACRTAAGGPAGESLIKVKLRPCSAGST